jgi:hypothetical protein
MVVFTSLITRCNALECYDSFLLQAENINPWTVEDEAAWTGAYLRVQK